MNRLPVYLVKTEIAPGLPPQQRYSIDEVPGAKLIGWVHSARALHLKHPCFSINMLLAQAVSGELGLSLEPAPAPVAVTEDDGETD